MVIECETFLLKYFISFNYRNIDAELMKLQESLGKIRNRQANDDFSIDISQKRVDLKEVCIYYQCISILTFFLFFLLIVTKL